MSSCPKPRLRWAGAYRAPLCLLRDQCVSLCVCVYFFKRDRKLCFPRPYVLNNSTMALCVSSLLVSSLCCTSYVFTLGHLSYVNYTALCSRVPSAVIFLVTPSKQRRTPQGASLETKWKDKNPLDSIHKTSNKPKFSWLVLKAEFFSPESLFLDQVRNPLLSLKTSGDYIEHTLYKTYLQSSLACSWHVSVQNILKERKWRWERWSQREVKTHTACGPLT